MKKRLFLSVLLLCTHAYADNISTTLEQFAKSKSMLIDASQTVREKSNWSYELKSSKKNQSDTMSISYMRANKDECIDNALPFGDLPLNVAGKKALFTLPKVSDNSSTARDFLNVYDGKGCYTVSYGQNGSGFDDAVALMRSLIKK